MRYLLYLLFSFLSFFTFGQQDGLVYFGKTNGEGTDQLIGIKTRSGKIIIPAVYHSYYALPGDSVATSQVILWDANGPSTDAMKYDLSLIHISEPTRPY